MGAGRRLRRLRSLPRRSKYLLLVTALTIVLVPVLTLADRPEYALIPLAVLLAGIAVHAVLLERRVVSAVRRLDRTVAQTERPIDSERLEFMQQRILASIESGRLEVAERLDKIS